jgi:hypothetical protein
MTFPPPIPTSRQGDTQMKREAMTFPPPIPTSRQGDTQMKREALSLALSTDKRHSLGTRRDR